MLFNLSLRYAQHLGELVRCQPGAGQAVDDALSWSLFGERHAAMVDSSRPKAKAGLLGIAALHMGREFDRITTCSIQGGMNSPTLL